MDLAMIEMPKEEALRHFERYRLLVKRGKRRALAEELHRRQVIEAVKRVRAGAVTDRRKRSERHHLAGSASDEDVADVLGETSARVLPSRQVALFRDLERPEDGGIHIAAAYHGERFVFREITAAR